MAIGCRKGINTKPAAPFQNMLYIRQPLPLLHSDIIDQLWEHLRCQMDRMTIFYHPRRPPIITSSTAEKSEGTDLTYTNSK
jgi:hypothetical protein